MSGQAIAIIQARMSSSRLPGKVMMPLAGRPMIWHIVERARACRLVEKVVVATSTERSDDPLAACCQQEGIDCFRGSLDNVLSRFIKILDDYPYEYYVRITGDCPLIDPENIDRQIHAVTVHDADAVWMSKEAKILAGQGVHSSRALRLVNDLSIHPDDLEHVGSRYFSEHSEQFKLIGLDPPKELTEPQWRFTVDHPEDFRVMAALYKDLWRGAVISLREAIYWMEVNSGIAAKNQDAKESMVNLELQKIRSVQKPRLLLHCDWTDPGRTL